MAHKSYKLSKKGTLKLVKEIQRDNIAQEKRLKRVLKGRPDLKRRLKQATARGLSDKGVKVQFKKRSSRKK